MILLSAGTVWLVGLGLFASLLPAPPVQPLPGDCVAVASGRHDRLITAIEQYGRRAEIFVSGATEGTNHLERDDMRQRNPGWFDGHVQFGWDARNTRENGVEIARWESQRGCSALIALSHDLHLPRLLLALRRAGYDAPIAVHAVASRPAATGPIGRFNRLAAAWTRYLVALLIDW